MVNEEFINLYTMHPIRYQLTTYQDELCSIFTEEQEENNQDNSDKKKSDQNIIISKQMKNPKETVGICWSDVSSCEPELH